AMAGGESLAGLVRPRGAARDHHSPQHSPLVEARARYHHALVDDPGLRAELAGVLANDELQRGRRDRLWPATIDPLAVPDRDHAADQREPNDADVGGRPMIVVDVIAVDRQRPDVEPLGDRGREAAAAA